MSLTPTPTNLSETIENPGGAVPGIIRVAAALIFREGRLLIAQRRAGDHLGGYWEFPGGKLEPGESFESCVVREVREELGAQVEIVTAFEQIEHAYPGKRVLIRFFTCRWLAGEPRPLGAQAVRWIDRLELSTFQFPAADALILEKLRQHPWPNA